MKISTVLPFAQSLMLVAALASCGLPRGGPSHRSVLNAQGTEKDPAGIAVIEVSPAVSAKTCRPKPTGKSLIAERHG